MRLWILGISAGLAAIWWFWCQANQEEPSTRRHLEAVLKDHERKARKVQPFTVIRSTQTEPLRKRA